MLNIQQIQNPSDLTGLIKRLKAAGKSIGLVPTMGALHEGHMQLIKKAKVENDVVVCSIFVNPTQFNNKEDLTKYPRTLEADLALLDEYTCDIAFVPRVEDVYAPNESVITIVYNGLDKVMEGPHRPGHFDGVVTIVSKLFDICIPDKAYFGEKDFQQLAVIQAMTKQMGYAVSIIPCAIVRAASGLALSSRNSRLSVHGITQAAAIYDCLVMAKELSKTHTVEQVKDWVRQYFDGKKEFTLEYFELCNSSELTPIKDWNENTSIRGFLAAHLEGVRLIDNLDFST